MTIFSTLDAIVAARSLLQHPFYLRWSKGELTLDELRIYAKEYYHLVRAVPTIVASVCVRARVIHPAMVPAIERNVREEREHIVLWERFARSLGIAVEELRQHVPSASVREAVEALEAAADRTFEDGVAVMYSMEVELPKIARTKKEGLLRFYGLSSADAHAYFDEHLREEEHLQVWRSCSVASEQRETAHLSMEAQNRVLDGVCAAAGIAMQC
jgi:pyrroloquinoline-quinone synthase